MFVAAGVREGGILKSCFERQYMAFLQYAGTNEFTDYAGNYGYGGAFMLTWIPPQQQSPVSDIATGFGIAREPKTWFHGIAQTENYGTYRFARRSDKTNVKFSVDKPSFTE